MWIESDRLVVVGDGFVVFLFVAPCEAPVDERAGILWIESDRLVVVGDGDVVFFLMFPNLATL